MSDHNHPQSKIVINRLSRLIGHLNGIKKMAEEGRDCSDLIVQLSAVRSAINNVGSIILEDHINHCIVEAVENNDKESLNSLTNAINKFIGTKSKPVDSIH